MNDAHARRRSLESLRKEAKRWLRLLESHDPDAHHRLTRALANASAAPTLRDVQHALAREQGFAGWSAMKEAIAADVAAQSDANAHTGIARYETMATTLLEAYRTGTPDAMERLYQFSGNRRSWEAMREYLQLDLGKRPVHPGEDVEITLDDARFVVAKGHGFVSWDALAAFVDDTADASRIATRPVKLEQRWGLSDARTIARSRDWDEIFEQLDEHPTATLHAEGQMTDALLAELAQNDRITSLDLSGSKALTNDGLRALRRLPHLEYLNLGGTHVTDEGLAVLHDLPSLRRIELWWTSITDAGVAYLSHCPHVERVNLGGTRSGDGAIRALAGMPGLAHFQSGEAVTDAGIPLLHEFPVFKQWHGGEARMALLSYEAEPNYLMLRGPFTDRGIQSLRGLDGLFALNLDDAKLQLTAASMLPLETLPNLGWLAVDAKDDWMPHIARMPKLRFLGVQDTVAGDDGWTALSESTSIEYIWGRRCHNLRTPGFTALSRVPALRGLSVSCLNVDDEGIAALPEFPALRELMPMDIPDAGYRHIGRCTQLESLVLMYCRDTTDAATEHITGLPRLSHYFNSYTTITDRTAELLSGMESLEHIMFDACHGLTDAGIAKLARLPRLRAVRASGRNLTGRAAMAFAPHVEVHINE